MLDFITRFFKREEASKTLAKERLRLVLMSDRVSLAPDIFDEMKGEMLAVIRRYLDIDERALDMHFENLEQQFALLASIPVLKVRTAEEIRTAALARAGTNGASANGAAAANGHGANGAIEPSSSTNGAAALGSAANGKPAGPRRRRRRRRPTAPPPGHKDPAAPAPEPNIDEPGAETP